MTAPDPAKKLHALLKKLHATYGEEPADKTLEGRPPEVDALVWQFVFSFLAWEAGVARATTATKRLHTSVVDYNEMRVCLADELASVLGDRYPRALERASRLRSALNDLYRREHAVTLAGALAMPKREARVYIEALEGTPSYVAARMLLLALGGHAFPLDERIHLTLLEEEAIPPDLSLAEAESWLERQFRAGEAASAYLVLEAWLNERPAPKPPAKKPAPKPAEPPKAKAESAPEEAEKATPAKRPAVAGDKPKNPRPKKAAKE